MKKEFIITVFCFVLMFFGGAFSPEAKAATLYVNDASDGPVRNGSCIGSNGCTLREALSRSRNGDDILFSSLFNTPQTITLTQGTPLTNPSGGTVTIHGNGESRLTINGNNTTQIFYVAGGGHSDGDTINLFGMTLTNGNLNNPSSGGGAIYVTDGSVYLNDVIISNCSAQSGGAIFSLRGNVYIDHSTIYNNGASYRGSAIYSRNDQGRFSDLKITNSTVSGNTSPNSEGAAIYNEFTQVSIVNSTITKNSASGGSGAGGILNSGIPCRFGSCPSSLAINSSIVAENPNVGSPNISGTINSQSYSLLGGNPLLLPLADNQSQTVAGVHLPTHALDNCSPAINAGDPNTTATVDERYAGRVNRGRADIGAYESDFTPCPASITVTNNNDSGDGSLRQAVNDIAPGGTISFPSGGADITLTSGEIVVRRDMNVGGGNSYPVTVHGNNQSRIFSVLSNISLNLSKIVLADGNAHGAGGGAIDNFGTLTVTSSAIVNNTAQDGGGISNNGTLSITNTTVSGNHAVNKGAGIYNNPGGATASVLHATITNNRSDGFAGAGVWNDHFSGSNTFSARNSIIAGNISGNGNPVDYVGDLNNQGYNLINVNVPLNPLGNYGGATLTHELPNCSSPALDAADPNNVVATDQRGNARPFGGRADIGAFESTQSCSITVINSNSLGYGTLDQALHDVLDGGRISFAPGVNTVYVVTGPLTIYNKNVTINVNPANPVTLQGNNRYNLLYIDGSATANLTGLNFTGGTGGTGGAIQNYGTLNASFINVYNNQASLGGGIYNKGTMNVTNSTVSGNTGDGVLNDGTLTLSASTVSGNTGGGILNSATLLLLNSTVSGNQANGKGAGIYNNGGGIIATIINSTITDNHGFGYAGAGVWNESGSTVRVRNSIIDGNFSDSGSPDYVGGLTNQGNNLIGSGNSRLAPLGNYGGATQTHALLQNSAALDAGNNCVLTANGCGDGNPALTTDQRGAPRKVGSAVDIGAFERNITFDQMTLPNGQRNVPYNQTLTVSRETNFFEITSLNKLFFNSPTALAFAIIPITGQSLPPGLSLSTSGTISGTPTAAGTYTFTVKATDSDGMAGVSQYTIFINNPPTISDITDRTINSNASTGAISFTVGDAETPASNLVVTATSSNTTLVPNAPSNITLGGSGANRTIAVTPALNQSGTATISVTVTDANGGSTTDTFLLTVIAPPTLAETFTPSSIQLNGTSVLQFTLANPNSSSALNTLAFTDSLPSGVTAPNTNATTVCTDGSYSISSNVISFSKPSLAGGANCIFSVTVTGTTVGTKTNTTSTVTTGNSGAGAVATANLTVTAAQTIGGAKTVCATGCDYVNLTGTSGLFAAINNSTVTGNITANITGDLTEDGANALNQWTESGAGNYTLTIQPSGGAARTISGNVNNGLIRLNGADRVTIDGLNTGGNGLTIINNSAANNTAVIWLESLGAGQGATNDTIRNTAITGGSSGSNTIATFGIIAGGTTLGFNDFGDDNDNITIQGNTITKVQNGIYVEGNAAFLQPAVSAGGDDNLTISGNVVGPATAGASNIGGTGIFVLNAVAPNLSGNTVRNVIAPAELTYQGFPAGITLINASNGVIAQNAVSNVSHPGTTNAMYATGILVDTTDTGTQVSGNTISGVTATATNTGGNIVSAYGITNGAPGSQITGNTVTSVISSSTTGCPARGIWLTTTPTDVTLANNFVSDIQSFSFDDTTFRWQPVGIYIDANALNIKLYYNSVNLFGAHAGTAAATMQTALFVDSFGSGLDLRDNIFVNSYDNSSSSSDKSYSIYSNSAASAFANTNYNDYYVNGSAGVLGFIGSDQTTLAQLQTGTGQDSASVSGDPQFVSTTNLHINTSVATTVSNAGTPIAGITTDIDGDTRSATTPDIGADEFVSNPPAPITTHFSVNAPATATAGSAFNFTVTALDASNNAVAGYVGTIHFNSTSAGTTLPPDYTFVAGDNGAHTFSAMLNATGNQTITATDTGNASITGTSGSISVSSAPVSDLTITKTHTGSFTQGQTGAQYAITVTNSGNLPTSGTVTVIDTLPSGLTATAIGGTGWTCNLGTLTCTRSDALANGASYPVITLTVNVANNAPASVTNTASVSGGSETNTSNDTANDLTTITGSPTNPGGTGAATPSSMQAGNSTLLTVTVTPGTNPASTGIIVTTNLSGIGGAVAQTFYDDGTNGDALAGDNIFSFNANVAAATSAGVKTLPVTIADAQSRSGSTNISLTVTAASNTVTWVGGASGDASNWNNAANWNPATIPTSTSDVVIPASGVSNEPIISNNNQSVNSLDESSGRTLTVNSGRALTITSSCAINGTMNVAGAFNCGSLTSTGTINFTGTSVQTIPAGVYNNLIVNNSAGVSLSGNVTINGTLTLTNGIITTGAGNSLTIGSSGSISGASASSYVIGNLRKIFSGNNGNLQPSLQTNLQTDSPDSPALLPSAFLYPVGTASGLSPVTINAKAGGGNLAFTVSATESFLSGVNTAQSIRRFWTLNPDGITQADVTFQYLDGDVPAGANESNFNFIRRFGSTNTYLTPTSFDAATNIFTLNDVTQFSDWSLGTAPLVPTAAMVSVSGRALTPSGRGLMNAVINLTDADGNTRATRTNSFGYYRFADIAAGETYVFTIVSKHFQFTPQVVTVMEDIDSLNFSAVP
ncbi:MAG: putative Ig domain-containing protein [Acidobacteriota bacterium]|nr:putative Ig domain-containing protein [Acidobacteriota bacterium]